MEMCECEEIEGGHYCSFDGEGARFTVSGGPDEWTEEMSRKAAVFFWLLKHRDEGKGNIVVVQVPRKDDASTDEEVAHKEADEAALARSFTSLDGTFPSAPGEEGEEQ